jgi:hypothetical protein
MNLKLGLPCVYRPRVPYGRQSELFCFVTRIIDEGEGRVDLITFPANSEPVHYNNIPPRSETIQIHCWEPALEADSVDDARLNNIIAASTAPLAGEIAILKATLESAKQRLAELGKMEGRLVALEKRPARSGQGQL